MHRTSHTVGSNGPAIPMRLPLIQKHKHMILTDATQVTAVSDEPQAIRSKGRRSEQALGPW